MVSDDARAHIIPYRTLAGVWLLLIGLTAALVVAGKVYHEALSVAAMLILTPVKAGLVFFYFMHLRYEKTYLKALVFMTLGLLTLVIGLLFFDVLYR